MKKRDSHIFAKAKNGWYVEPSWCAERLFEAHRFSHHDVIWDPACGWGTITTAAKKAGYDVFGSDIVDRRRHQLVEFKKLDFLQPIGALKLGKFSVVCNPPFTEIETFSRRALELGANKVAMIMLVRRLNAAHWVYELPLMRVFLLTPRPSMPPGEWIAAGNKPGGGTQDFCWLLFDRHYVGRPTIEWLHRDGGTIERARKSA